jgi:hypothetical protein
MKRRVLLCIEVALVLAVVLVGYVQAFASVWRWLASLF